MSGGPLGTDLKSKKYGNMNLENELDVIRARWGPWTAHNIQLNDNIFTISKNAGNRVSDRADLYLKLIKIFSHKIFQS